MTSRLSDFDPDAKLVNVNYQGKRYTVTTQGATHYPTAPQKL